MDDSLAMAAGKFKIRVAVQRKYKVDIVNRPSIPYNSKYQKVFEDEMKIKRFLELSSEFVNTQIDNEDNNVEILLDIEQIEEDSDVNKKLNNSLGGKTQFN